LQAYITHHLRPLLPVQIPYTIRVDEEFHKNPQPTIYDVRVAVDDPIKARLLPFMQDPQYASILKEVAGLDDKLATLVQGITASKAKHSFFDAASRDPVTFIRTWLSSQKRDLEVIMGEAPRGGGEEATGDEWRRSDRNGVWSTEEARESVNFHLAKLLQQQHLQAQQGQQPR
jgi:SWI/SNF-related matrix-associated actin-dependent regulator of chromatin subfamily D